MSAQLRSLFKSCKDEKRTALVSFVTAGFPSVEETIPIMLALQEGGTDIIELGMPFTDPIADGPTIQKANFIALENGVTIAKILDLVKEARSKGLYVPVMLMGYFNPVNAYGEERLVLDAKNAGANGFLLVDLPPEDAIRFRNVCTNQGLSYIPLIAPSTDEDRLKELVPIADSFVYVVSRMGTTGATGTIDTGAIDALLERVRASAQEGTSLALGFGVSTREHFIAAGKHADAVVVGSALIDLINKTPAAERIEAVKNYSAYLVGNRKVEKPKEYPDDRVSLPEFKPSEEEHVFPSRFGDFGGQYVPEALHSCLDQLEKGFTEAANDPKFWEEYRSYFDYIGRPSSLHLAPRLTEQVGGARIWLKREDLNHTGSHKINNAIGQVLIAKRLGKNKIIAETGAGQHGVATATVAAKFGMKCKIYMGAEDVRRQALNVFRMKLLGAEVVPVTAGTMTLRDATSEAMRSWVTSLDDTHYILGSATGPHPFPTMVRTFQSVIGRETKEQFAKKNDGRLPDAVVACVGGGSNCSGMFSPFEKDLSVKLLGVEAGGDGVETKRHGASLTKGKEGVLHGVRSYILQNEDGQIQDTHSISAGLDYPGVGPELAFWKKTGRAEFVACKDVDALIGFRALSQAEGIIPAVESSHAVWGAMELAKKLGKDKDIVICISGRGDKDVQYVAELLPHFGPMMNWDLRFEADGGADKVIEGAKK